MRIQQGTFGVLERERVGDWCVWALERGTMDQSSGELAHVDFRGKGLGKGRHRHPRPLFFPKHTVFVTCREIRETESREECCVAGNARLAEPSASKMFSGLTSECTIRASSRATFLVFSSTRRRKTETLPHSTQVRMWEGSLWVLAETVVVLSLFLKKKKALLKARYSIRVGSFLTQRGVSRAASLEEFPQSLR